MNRRNFLKNIAMMTSTTLVIPFQAHSTTPKQGEKIMKIHKTDDEWQKILSPQAYDVLRHEGTERAFSSPLHAEHREGTYVCAGCALPLFHSTSKFDSGTGWPSFFKPIEGHTETKRDFKLILPRTEYHCIRCGGHQGHVFKDGPEPTGQRWCNNGVALNFIATINTET